MSTSTVPALKGAVLDLLAAAPALAGVQVEWTHPGPNALQAECVYFGDSIVDEQAVVNGNRRRDESYRLDVVVSVEHYTTDARATEERAWQLAAAIEDVVRQNPRPLPEVLSVMVGGKRQANYPDTDGRVSEVVVSLSCRARI